jgi:hypothetical protein
MVPSRQNSADVTCGNCNAAQSRNSFFDHEIPCCSLLRCLLSGLEDVLHPSQTQSCSAKRKVIAGETSVRRLPHATLPFAGGTKGVVRDKQTPSDQSEGVGECQ